MEHRQENVLDIEKALFINDSKATNADATLPALKTYSNIYWIVGGIAKAEGIIPLLPYLQNIEKILLIGESSVRFKNELKDVKQAVYISKTLEKALEMIKKENAGEWPEDLGIELLKKEEDYKQASQDPLSYPAFYKDSTVYEDDNGKKYILKNGKWTEVA